MHLLLCRVAAQQPQSTFYSTKRLIGRSLKDAQHRAQKVKQGRQACAGAAETWLMRINAHLPSMPIDMLFPGSLRIQWAAMSREQLCCSAVPRRQVSICLMSFLFQSSSSSH